MSFHHGNTFHQSGPNHARAGVARARCTTSRNGVEFARPALPYDRLLRAAPAERAIPYRAGGRSCACAPNASCVFMSSVRGCGSSITEVVGHARRPGGEDDDAGAEEAPPRVMPWVTNTIVLPASCQMRSSSRFIFSRVSASRRAERLVHQDRAWDRGSARARSRRAAACRPRARRGICPRRRARPTSASRSRALAALRPSAGRGSPAGSSTLSRIAPPLQQQRLLEHHADVARRIERLRRRADLHRRRRRADAGRRGSSAACVLPQPDGPDQRNRARPASTSKRRVGDRAEARFGAVR